MNEISPWTASVAQRPWFVVYYSEVSNRQADGNKREGMEKKPTLLVYSLSELINEHGGIFCLLHEKLQVGWKENLKNSSEHALLLGTSEYGTESLFILD